MSTTVLRTDGFYYSHPVEWEDRHAGVYMRETHYDFWRFYPDGIWLRSTRYEPDFDFWTFTNALTAGTLEHGRQTGTGGLMDDGLELFVTGTYSVIGDILTTRLERRMPLFPSGEQVFNFEWQWTVRTELLRSRERDDRTELRFTAGRDRYKRSEGK